MMSTFICLILIPVVALSVSIDEEILGISTSPHTFNFFQINSNGTVEVMLEYDMMMSIDQYKALNSRPKGQREKRAAVRSLFCRWPNEKVYFEITSIVWHYRSMILRAMHQWQIHTCIEFIESNTSVNRLSFTSHGKKCTSYVGYQRGVQDVAIDGCTYRVAMHELGHALGLIHEQSRPDRDFYVQIAESMVKDSNFKLRNLEKINSIGIPYDYKSIMHYGSQFITTLDENYRNRIGNNQGLAFTDIKVINLYYECRLKYSNCPPVTCPFNGFVLFKPFKGLPICTCWCDSGNVSDPLIPCCDIDREVPRPNIRSKSSNSERTIEKCYDLRTNCATLKERGMCYTNFKMMYRECTKTCNFCGKGDNLCMDYEDGCHIMAGSGACKEEGLEETMSKLCKKSCGLCRAVATPCDIEESFFELSRNESIRN